MNDSRLYFVILISPKSIKMVKGAYMPVDCHFYDQLTDLSVMRQPVKINYFVAEEQLDDVEAPIRDIIKEGKSEIALVGDHRVRLDQIVTLNGRPGPAYGLYESYSDACMSCNLGYDHQGNPKHWK